MIHPRRYIKRAWRSRGHGIHSPLAFRLVTKVIRGKGDYYASAQIRRGADPRWHMLLMRLLCDREPARVYLPNSPQATLDLLRHADTRIVLTDSPCEFNILARAPQSMAEWPEGITVIRHTLPSDRLRLRRTLPPGMTFTNGHTLIAVLRKDLPRQDFEIKF